MGTTAGATLGALSAVAFGLPATGAFRRSARGVRRRGAGEPRRRGGRGQRRAQVSDVLLAGIAITLATSALATGLQYASDSQTLIAAARWSLGQLPQVGYTGVCCLAAAVLPVWIGSHRASRALQTFAFGEELAHARGVDVPRLRFWVLGLGSFGVAACVAWCGPIAFVGLVVPHLFRLACGATLRRLLPLSIVAGAAFLVACDTLARTSSWGASCPWA